MLDCRVDLKHWTLMTSINCAAFGLVTMLLKLQDEFSICGIRGHASALRCCLYCIANLLLNSAFF